MDPLTVIGGLLCTFCVYGTEGEARAMRVGIADCPVCNAPGAVDLRRLDGEARLRVREIAQ
jgi:hypothetical protein